MPKMKIKVSTMSCGCCWEAKPAGLPESNEIWAWAGEGDSPDEAIGNLIRINPEFFNVEISYPD